MMSWMCRIAFPIVDPDPGRRGELKMTSKWTSFAESSCLSGNCVENNIRVLYLGGGGKKARDGVESGVQRGGGASRSPKYALTELLQ